MNRKREYEDLIWRTTDETVRWCEYIRPTFVYAKTEDNHDYYYAVTNNKNMIVAIRPSNQDVGMVKNNYDQFINFFLESI